MRIPHSGANVLFILLPGDCARARTWAQQARQTCGVLRRDPSKSAPIICPFAKAQLYAGAADRIAASIM